MTTFQSRTAALVACIALAATPSFAQRAERRGGAPGGQREGSTRTQSRDNGSGRSDTGRRAQRRGEGASQTRETPRARVTPQRTPSRERDANERGASRSRETVEVERRADTRARPAPRTAVPRGRVVLPPRSDRARNERGVVRGYGYRPYVERSYVLPYGYRPRGYRPGWNVNLYFGRPYAYGPRSGAYGYYTVVPGGSYGALRIVDAPRDAHVFVDGYYAGVVDDYDGVFQHLNLEAGSHHVEIEFPDYPLVAFDVYVRPGQTITYRANLR
jgi:hypothetical protein